MTDALARTIRRYTEANADALGIARTPIPGMVAVRATRPGELVYGIQRPLICLVVQGVKEVTTGDRALSLAAGDSMLITADVPTVSQIVHATKVDPYLSFVLDLDPALIADLAVEMKAVPVDAGGAVRSQPTDAEVSDAALRLLRLLDRPTSVPVLVAQLIRELHYWLLAGRHGPAIRHLGFPDGHARRIGDAVAVIRRDYAKPLRVEQLAAIAAMSVSTFHQHFRSVTTLTPLQFQKQLRLLEARRLMLADGVAPGHAAYAAGYESVPQFTREYGRLFGAPPGRDMAQARRNAAAA